MPKKRWKADEMEKYQGLLATRASYAFVMLCLLVWSIINLIQTGQLGVGFLILMGGSVVSGLSMIYYKRKMRGDSKKEFVMGYANVALIAACI
ncbi:MAG TPA: hypothetical protein VFK33_15085, partial [Bacillales bacterium]|nr:hypothetical protein [Bacillales bacterium]